jgi:hypothetical protein
VTDVAAVAGRVTEEWRQRHADWDPTPFAQAAATSGAALAGALADAADAEPVVDAYLRLVAEALHLRYIDRATCARLGRAEPVESSLLGRLLLDAVPRRLPAYGAGRRLALLADVWNLGEGLLRQASWMGRVASALTRDLDDLEGLGAALATTLAPLITSTRRSSFTGPFAVQVLDLREVDDEFLPGAMHAAAPAVLCVHDRVRAAQHGAVVLAPGGQSRSLGMTPCLTEDGDATSATLEVLVGEGRATIAGREVGLPSVHTAHGQVAFASGFVAVSAVDSQRLWIVESAS